MNKSYQKGKRFERETKIFLKNKGFLVVLQSKSVFPDIIAIEGVSINGEVMPIVYAVECKTNKYLSRKETEDLLIFKKKYGIIPCRAYIDKNNKHRIIERIDKEERLFNWRQGDIKRK